MDPAPLQIVLTGTESTGKTTLTRQLAAHFHAPHTEEYAREYLDAEGRAQGTLEDIEPMARGLLEREDRAKAEAGTKESSIYFTDTDLVLTALWSDTLFGECPQWVRDTATERAKEVAQYLVLAPDVPWESDPQRCLSDEAERKRFHDELLARLRALGVPCRLIEGDGEDRFSRACTAVHEVLASQGLENGVMERDGGAEGPPVWKPSGLAR